MRAGQESAARGQEFAATADTMVPLPIPGLRAELEGVDLFVELCFPAAGRGPVPDEEPTRLLGNVTVRQVGDPARTQALPLCMHDRPTWEALCSAYLRKDHIRATGIVG